MIPFPIHTERLTLIPFTTQICQEVLEGNFESLSELGLVLGEGWPDKDMMDTLPRILKNLSKVEAPTGFESWMIIQKDTRKIIGDIGFKGYNFFENSCDIGYGIIEAERKKGYATEACLALINWAFEHESLETITAATLEDNENSIKLLQKLNFEITTQEEGMIFWELKKFKYQIA